MNAAVLAAAFAAAPESSRAVLDEFAAGVSFARDAPGAWVAYEFVDPGGRRYIRFAIVEDRVGAGTARRSLEVWLDRKGLFAMKLPLDASGAPGRRAKFRTPMGIEWVDLSGERKTCSTCGAPLPEGNPWASIKTPAGTFRAFKAGGVRDGRWGYFWKSPEVPILGIVRYDIDANARMELVGLGTNAETAVPEDAPVHPTGTLRERLGGLAEGLLGLAPLRRDGGAAPSPSGRADAGVH